MRMRADRLLIVAALVFMAYLTVRSLVWTDPVPHRTLFILAEALLVIATVICLAVPSPAPSRDADLSLTAGADGPSKLPVWAAMVVPFAAAVVPTASSLAVHHENLQEPYATSYLGQIGLLATITMIRRRPMFAWLGIALLAISSVVWLGLAPAIALGLSGSVLWTAAAQFSVRFLDRVARDTKELIDLQRASIERSGMHDMRRRERRDRVSYALAVAGPVLERVVASGGQLTEAERFEARLAESRLRDELRGSRLLDDRVREALAALRRGGSTVMLYDEGGLAALSSRDLAAVRSELAATLERAHSERIIVRTATHAQVAVTIVGRAEADEDDVDLWHEIPRP